MSLSRTIYGNPPAKANSYRIGNGRFYKADSVKKYEADFIRQWVNQGEITGRFELSLIVYFRSDRSDLDNSAKVILDLLQTVKAISNDRNCMKIYAEKRIDQKEPRIEIKIKEH